MTAAVVVPRAGALGRAAAGLAPASAAVHLLLLDASSLGSLLMVAMAAICLPCAWHLWRSPTAAVWGMTAAVDGVMLVAHAQMLGGAAHEMAGMHASGTPTALMWLGLGLVVTQLALAGAAGLSRHRWECAMQQQQLPNRGRTAFRTRSSGRAEVER
jgi:hypothetical protein